MLRLCLGVTVNQILVSLDIEMTTPRPENQEILEIAAIKFKGHKVLDSFSTLVNPRCSIPYNIQVLTGISQADVDRAPAFSEIAGDLLKFIGDSPLVGHTVSSDVSCLERKGVILSNKQIDTFELASILLPHLTNYSLASLAQHFGISFRAHHRAADDALATKELFLALIDKAAELDLSIVQEIIRLTAFIDWPLTDVFRYVEREKARTAFEGASIRSRLAAKSGLEDAALDVMFAGRPAKETLVPSGTIEPVDVKAVTGALGPGGLIAENFTGYEHRPQQVAMMEGVAAALNNGRVLVVEAGTGVGKSLAYLLPSIHFSLRNRQHIVVSTNTINLQDQLFNKDLPELQRILGLEFRSALVKGRSNYLCQRRWAMLRRHSDLSRSELLTLVKILVWLPSTSSGDVAELNLTEEQRSVWSKLCAQAETCLGNQCVYFRKGSCFLFRARQRAQAANVIVVNHSLLLSDLISNSRVLPDYRYLIIDEAHHFEDEATQQFGFSVSDRDVAGHLDGLSQIVTAERRLGILSELRSRLQAGKVPKGRLSEIDDVIKKLHKEVDTARDESSRFFSTLTSFVNQHRRENRGYDTRLRLTPTVRTQPDWSKVEVCWDSMARALSAIEDDLGVLLGLIGKLDDFDIPEYESTVAELTALLFCSQEFRNQLNQAITNPVPDQVYWASLSSNSSTVTVNAAPLHVGPILEKNLFLAKSSVVLTSATLSTAGSFEFVKGRLGLSEAEELLLGSPFDYGRAALLYIPDDIPEPDRPGYQQHLESALISLVKATKGRALVLFTSHNHLRQTHQGIRSALQEEGILAVAHGLDGSARQLLQTLKTNPQTVLLGTSSFWEGVDVVGDALSVLVIVRLPFAVPTDPVVAARSEQFDDPFNEYSVPQSILKFKQGFGRLIRSRTDRGVAVVMDRRIVTRSYGQLFLRSLPPCSVRRGPARALPREAATWLRTARM